jgi:hypothetical protein
VPETPDELAVMVELPAVTAVATPPELIVAVAVLEELHVAVEVSTFVDPSLYVPVAVNCCVAPTVIDDVAGVTAIEDNVGGGAIALTVNTAVPDAPEKLAVIVEVPAATAVATPEELIVAVAVLEELHVAIEVRSLVDPSL